MLDASIPLQVRQAQIDSPLDSYAKVAGLQQMQSQNALANLTLQQHQNALALQNNVAQAMADSNGDYDAAVKKISTLPGGADLAIKMSKDLREGKKTEAETKKLNAETVGKIRDYTGAMLTGLLADPDVNAGTPAAMEKVFQAIRAGKGYGVPDENINQALESMPRDPSQLVPWLKTKAAQHAQTVEQAVKMVSPDVQIINNGQTQIPYNKNSMAPGGIGQVQGAQVVQNQATPGELLTDKRGREELGISRARLALEQSKANEPQFKDGYWVTKPTAANPQGTVIATPVATPPKGSELATQQSNEKVKAIIAQARPLLEDATGSWSGAAGDLVANLVGKSTEGATAIAQLKALEGALMMAQPRMEGPQSDKDVALYRQMAAQLGDPTIPKEQKIAALNTLESLHQKYPVQAETPKPSVPRTFQAMPDPASYNGKTVRDDASGIKYKSDGTRWVRVR